MSKRKEIVDLTLEDDDEEPEPKRNRPDSAAVVDLTADDEQVAKQLQAEYDREYTSTPWQGQSILARSGVASLASNESRLKSFGQALKNERCCNPLCSKHLVADAGDALNIFKKWINTDGRKNGHADKLMAGKADNVSFSTISSVVRCPRRVCYASTCIGCGFGGRSPSVTCKAEVEGVGALQWCCDYGRLCLVWMLLCGYDRRQLNLESRGSPSSSKVATMPGHMKEMMQGPMKEMMPAPMKEMKQGPMKSGIGYGSRGKHNHSSLQEKIDPDDELTRRILDCLIPLLPSWTNRESTMFDDNPPQLLTTMLVQSRLLHRVAALLRNDSLEDATRRAAVYQSVLRFVATLAGHPATAEATVHQERPEVGKNYDLLTSTFSVENVEDKSKERESNQSIASCLANFNRQSKLMIARFKENPDNFQDAKDMLNLCHQISDLSDFLLANSTQHPTSNTEPTSQSKDSWQSALAMIELPEADLLTQYKFKGEAANIACPVPGRMKALHLEIGRLMTSLPSGIFVRHAASRPDIMKILIIGPEGTPYENGLFEFDLFCPAAYPKAPPKMDFKTTGNGRICFNPNLYADGKVCLSLLGTWEGEPWTADRSTILQVLLSIQAMIFCERPWFNEPGRERVEDHGQSDNYNRTCRANTVEHAMVYWLEGNEGIWGDVVMQHFASKKEELLSLVQKWGVQVHLLGRLKQALKAVGGD
ncbi:MAG: glycylpeptide N-tetradecanoyltransferase [Bogoriella megaspora]|nr:MAG: glycylpeptide N-tetradecanoyltransferase [Bogoriella megaspora]